jgi:hypothetical protein
MEQGAAYELLLPFRRAIQQNDTVPGRYAGEALMIRRDDWFENVSDPDVSAKAAGHSK